ncbi:hypothetical protein GCK32_006560 [Trichostrongylus colubriformis]|uniref:Uncharacterized protein n=1 Tax=Trichostrongylus colubriformis TaxID=6319 RepID=A0AAN8G448_TRICO
MAYPRRHIARGRAQQVWRITDKRCTRRLNRWIKPESTARDPPRTSGTPDENDKSGKSGRQLRRGRRSHRPTNLKRTNGKNQAEYRNCSRDHLRSQNNLIELSCILEKNAATELAEPIIDEAIQPRLAPLPIPKFQGQQWEWDHFWSIFETLIHRRKISKIEKLIYLLEALQGPAMDAVKDLQITADNYDVAIQFLRKKYDDHEAVTTQLLPQLQDLRPRSTTIADQMHTFDKNLYVISQLEREGENTDTQHMRRTILSKFSDSIQRSMLKKKAESQENWTTKQLVKDLQEFFYVEIRFKACEDTWTSTRGNSL